MNGQKKILRISKIIDLQLSRLISTKEIDTEDPKIKITLKDGITIYIQYNDHDQYSYNIIFSQGALDRCRFDNYDAHWDVKSKPHHFHPRFSNQAINSPMDGNPIHDMNELIQLLRTGKLFENSFL